MSKYEIVLLYIPIFFGGSECKLVIINVLNKINVFKNCINNCIFVEVSFFGVIKG